MISYKKNSVFIIPVYNEESTICSVVQKALIYSDVIVIDDCSTDNTKKEILKTSAIAIFKDQNIGYEKAIVEGLKKAISLGYTYAITLDGDGQLNPAYFEKFYSSIQNSEIVIGIRNSRPRHSEKIAGLITFILFGIYDPFCGLKGYNLNTLKKVKNLYTTKSIGTELLLRLAKGKKRVKQINIIVNERNGESTFGKNSFALNLSFLFHFTKTLITSKPI